MVNICLLVTTRGGAVVNSTLNRVAKYAWYADSSVALTRPPTSGKIRDWTGVVEIDDPFSRTVGDPAPNPALGNNTDSREGLVLSFEWDDGRGAVHRRSLKIESDACR